MQIIESTRKQLNDFLLENNGSFQQSYEWGELQESMGRRTKRLLITDNHNRAVASALFVRHDLPLGKYYWIAPRGPVVPPPHEEGVEEVIEVLKARLTMTPLTSPLTRGENAEAPIFIRLEPQLSSTYNSQLTTLNLWHAPHDHNPRATILIDLEKGEDALLAEMHEKTRYNIRLAERKGVNIEYGISNMEYPVFLNLLKKTAGRDEFHLHPTEYYEKLLRLPFIELFSAYYQGRLIAGAIVAIFGNRATYLHGASDYEHRKLMAPHLLHWEIIRQLKARGLKYYDLGGISPKADPIRGWEGLTRFKQGFGGEYYETIGSMDYALSGAWYMIYKIAKKIL